jgi:histidinol dehydrogenase
LRRLVLSGHISQQRVRDELPRAESSVEAATASVKVLCEEVRVGGVAALRDHSQRFDGIIPAEFRVLQSALEAALSAQSPELTTAIKIAIERVRKVSRATVPKDLEVELGVDAIVQQRYVPVDSVGLYVPGGKAVYPSSVVMNVVAAQEAGVPRLAICSPAQAEFGGLPHPSILAAAHLLGVTEVYAIGGATAVAALAYGVPEIGLEPVKMVTGPGNIYVATAKRLLRGVIGIDSEAGPTEILILADEAANPEFIAADLISQAEHDENAAAVLVTPSSALLDAVDTAVQRQLQTTKNSVRAKTALSGMQSALVLVDSMQAGIEVANHYATEHLEIQTANDDEVLAQISNAGAVFVGSFSPVSLGDYLAGSNHVLPTGEQAKFGPGLGVHTFLRPQQIIRYGKSGLEKVTEALDLLSQTEGLPAHGQAARVRFLSN